MSSQSPANSEVLFTTLAGVGGNLGLVTLNRPQALNAISAQMITALWKQLYSWAYDSSIKAVVITGNGDKAFSAGGDIKAVYATGKIDNNVDACIDFFRTEYRLNYLIKFYPKPYISLVHGITMGGGLGVSNHASHRVASPNLVWAMPETGIGFFTDVGASFFLSRCNPIEIDAAVAKELMTMATTNAASKFNYVAASNIGMYFALNGTRLSIHDALFFGLIDYCIEKSKFPSVISALAQTDFSALTTENAKLGSKNKFYSSSSSSSNLAIHDAIHRTLQQFSAETTVFNVTANNANYNFCDTNAIENLNFNEISSLPYELRHVFLNTVSSIFSTNNLEQLMHSLNSLSTSTLDNNASYTAALAAWAKSTTINLTNKSPTSLAITLHALNAAKNLSFAECMNMEFAISRQCLHGNEFYEGIRAVVIDKDNSPQWQPRTISTADNLDLTPYFPQLIDWLDLANIF